MCQKPESRLLTDDGEKATPVLYKGTEEGRERLRSQTPTKAEDRLYKQLLPLKFCLKSYIKTVSPSLIFNRIIQVNSQSMDLLLLSQNLPTYLPAYHASNWSNKCWGLNAHLFLSGTTEKFSLILLGVSYWYRPPFVVKFPMHMKTFKYFVTFSFCTWSFISRLFRLTEHQPIRKSDLCCKEKK